MHGILGVHKPINFVKINTSAGEYVHLLKFMVFCLRLSLRFSVGVSRLSKHACTYVLMCDLI